MLFAFSSFVGKKTLKSFLGSNIEPHTASQSLPYENASNKFSADSCCIHID